MDILRKVQKTIIANALLAGTLAGVVSGFLLGILLKALQDNEVVRSLVGYPGELYMRALQLLIIPVILFSLIEGSASINIKTNGKIGLRTFGFFLITSLCNAAFGVMLAVLIHPGDSTIKVANLHNVRMEEIEDRRNTLLDNFLDLGRNVVPNNLFTSFFEMSTTVFTQTGEENIYVKSIGSRRGLNAIGLIFYALLFGSVMSLLEEKAKPLLDVVRAVNAVNTKTISGLIALTPFGVASLICAKVLEVDDMGKMMSSMIIFVITVLIGILVYQFIILQLLYFLFVRKNPFKLYAVVLPALLTGFATDSSAASMPVTLKCLDKFGVDTRVSRFVVPIGVICNMDGTALFIAIASVFIAQINNILLNSGDYLLVVVTATAVSIAAAGAPSASLTLMPLVLHAIGAPIQDIALLFAIDWFCDRVRTVNNMLGDAYAATIVEHWSQKELTGTGDDDDDCESQKNQSNGITNKVEKIEMANVAV